MIPDTEGAAVVTTTVNVMANVEDKQTQAKALATLDFAFHFSVYCVLNRFIDERSSVLCGCFLCTERMFLIRLLPA